MSTTLESINSKRKPHNNLAGYKCELRNKLTSGHVVIMDCKLAEDQGQPIVENYKEEGGRYEVWCSNHATNIYSSNLPMARDMMKDPTIFCQICRDLAGEGDGESLAEFLKDHPKGDVYL